MTLRRPSQLTYIGSLVLLMLLLISCAPSEDLQPLSDVEPLAADEVPDYATHVVPILEQRCQACHQGPMAQGGYSVVDYDEVMTSGDHAPNVVGGDLESNLLRMVNGETIPAGGPMPPGLTLTAEEIDILTRWIEAGALPSSAETAGP